MKKIGLTQEVEKILEEAKLEEVKKKLDGKDDEFYSKNKLVEIGEKKQVTAYKQKKTRYNKYRSKNI